MAAFAWTDGGHYNASVKGAPGRILELCSHVGRNGRDERSLYKLVVDGESERIVGIHMIGPDAPEILQAAAIAVKAKLKKADFDATVALHPTMAEELVLTTAELSFLQERRAAYENLGTRVGLETVKSVTQALIQAERYGTPLAQALRVLAQECRDQRMNEAEKKAAALPPKLTVPMILFFLPVLVAVILGPAGIQVSDRF